MYHGHRRSAPYFEGWYYKLVSADEKQRLAIIPGVFLGARGHAFVQVLDGVTGRTTYHTYPLDAFDASRVGFDVRIGANRFAADHIYLDIDTDEGAAKGQVRFSDLSPWPVTLASPGIMGWYAWVPRMECNHGVLSLDHAIDGDLTVDGTPLSWSGGRGYIEKDWGAAFPSAWIWMQSNHFDAPGTSLTASVALIPWLGRTFRGFIVGFWKKGKLYRYATYTGAKTCQLAVSDDRVHWLIRDRHHTLELVAHRAQGALLKGPTRSEMSVPVHETLNASVTVRLSAGSDTIYEGEGRHAGLEVQGDLSRLLAP